MTLYLTQDEVRSILDMKNTIEAVESGFREMGLGNIEMPPSTMTTTAPMLNLDEIAHLREGGIVPRKMLSVIGEASPEAVIPLPGGIQGFLEMFQSGGVLPPIEIPVNLNVDGKRASEIFVQLFLDNTGRMRTVVKEHVGG